jgi:hypothetical protein
MLTLCDFSQDALLGLLKLVPELRILDVHRCVLDPLLHTHGASEYQDCTPILIEICPRLRRVHADVVYPIKRWEISHGDDGKDIITVLKYCAGQ